MRIKFDQIKSKPKSEPFDPAINGIVRDSFEKMARAEHVPTVQYNFRYGVCQSFGAIHPFPTPEEALRVIEKNKWFGKLTIENGAVIFTENVLNDFVDFSTEKGKNNAT